MSSSTPTPAAHKGAAAQSNGTRMDGGVAVPAASTQPANGDKPGAKPDWSGPKASASSSKTPFGGDDSVSPTDALNMKLSGHASRFEPGVKPSPINFLNRGSIEDDQPVIVTSTPTNKPLSEKARGKMAAALPPKPIGYRDGTPSPAAQPAVFSTDTGSNVPWVGGHYVRISNVAKDSFNECMKTLFDEMGWYHEVIGQKSSGVSSNKHLTIYMCFDDIKYADKAADEVAMVNQEWKVVHVFQPEYAAAGTNGDQKPTAFFDGQLLFTARFMGEVEYIKTKHVKEAIKTMAEHFGKLLAFNDAASQGMEWTFRGEFFKISAADKALEELHKTPYIFDDWRVTARKLPEPPRGGQGLTDGLAALDLSPHTAADGTHMSPTGRTAWGFDADGNRQIKPAPVNVPKINNPTDQVGGTMVIRQDRFSSIESAPAPASIPFFGPIDANMGRSGSWGGEVTVSRRNGRIGDENEPQQVNLDRITDGIDVRTTIMLRNLPNAWTYLDVKACLDKVCAGRYDFSYLRIDFQWNTNVGYAFVNFTEPEAIVDFVREFVNKEWERGYQPRKVAQVSYATVQGIDCLIEKFRNSAIMAEFTDYRPKLWYVQSDVAAGLCGPDKVGEERAFPPANNQSKHQRSMDNAGTVGLYQPRSRNGNGERARRSNYDRGTTHQLQEDAVYQQGPMSPFHENYSFGSPRAPIGAPPPFAPAMMPYGYPPMPAPFYNGYAPPYPQYESYDQYAQYPHPAYIGHPGYPAGYGPMPHGNPAARLRTISRGRLGGRPTNVTIAEHGYSDPERNARMAADGRIPRSITAAAEANGYFMNQAHVSADGNISPGNAEASGVGAEQS